jgi:phosphomannomutase/phosphoglucomutase
MMQSSNPSLYRDEFILGLVESELNETLYKSWGQSLARMLPAGSKFLVTSDFRQSSELFKTALVDGLLSNGMDVFDLGNVPTNLASYAIDLVPANASASVTGGNFASVWNGLRWIIPNCSSSIAMQIDQLRDEMKSPPESFVTTRGNYRTNNIVPTWCRFLKDVWYDTQQIPLKIILDPMYGNWAPFAQEALQTCFSQTSFESIHNEPKEDFGGMIPASRRWKSLSTLCSEVVRRRADLGIALEADAFSFALVDNLGQPLLYEEITWIVLHYLLGEAINGEVFLHDVNCSEKIIAEGIRLGASPCIVKNSHLAFLSKMQETNALIGFGFDGSIYFRGVRGRRIVVFAICWFLDYFTSLKMPLSEWRKRFPAFYATPELRTPLVSLEEIIPRLSAAWSCSPSSTLEGVRFVVPGGRIHVRLISDFAQLGFHFETDHRSSLHRIFSECCRALEGLDHLSFFLKEGLANWR